MQNEFKLIWQELRANCIIKIELFCYMLTLKFTRMFVLIQVGPTTCLNIMFKLFFLTYLTSM